MPDETASQCRGEQYRGVLRRQFARIEPCHGALARLAAHCLGRLEQTAKLVGAIMSAQDDPRLEPLRLTFGLEPGAFREGVFAWKGFLYYKRLLTQLKSQTNIASAELGRLVLLDVDDALLRNSHAVYHRRDRPLAPAAALFRTLLRELEQELQLADAPPRRGRLRRA